ncbi:MAG TPA: phage baseplate assembly protein V [Kofleriaceae bacterium]
MRQSDEDTLVELAELVRGRFFGKYRGVFDEIGEDEHLGYIRARVPDLYGENPSPWAEPAVPFAGEGYGFVSLPVRGDGVWIECVAGMRDRPIWTGAWWSSADDMPEGAAPKVRVWRSPNGHRIVIDDDADEIKLVHSSGAEIVMSDDGITLSKGRGKIEITDGKVSINEGAAEVE